MADRKTPKLPPVPPSSTSAERRARAQADLKRAQAKERRRSRLFIASGAVVAVVIVASAVIAISLGHDKSGNDATTGAASSSVTDAMSSVPSATFDTVGAGTASNPPTKISAPALTSGGKPKVLYVGAEYCPYCAAERWAIVAALSRFGTFSNLGQTTSSSVDVDPSTPTLSFHGSSYTSDYLAFTGVETTSNQQQGSGYAPLDTLSAADQKTFSTYNQPPYVSTSGSIPFVDIGGSYVSSGASYDPGLFKGMTHEAIAKALSDPTSDIAKAVDGEANAISAAVCTLTGNKPADVCTSTGVTAAAAKLGGR